MKYLVLLSGALGFALATLAGVQAQRPFELILRDAAVVCLGTALLGRWFWHLVEQAAAQTADLRRAAARAAAATEIAKSPTPGTADRASRFRSSN